MGNQRISDLTPIQSGSLAKNANVIPVVSGNETYQLTLTDLQSDIDAKSLEVSGSVGLAYAKYFNAAWETGGALSTPRYRTPGGAGDKNSALAFGGYTYSTYIQTGDTEAYDGTSWSAQNPMIQGRSNLAGFGSQDAAVAVGGNNCTGASRGDAYACTEEYDGATWTVGGALSSTPSGRSGLSAVGTQNAGLAFGGYPEYVTPQTEKYDGSAWSSAAALNSTRYNSAGAGTQNAALMFGGASDNTPDYFTTCTEEYNGTTWSVQTGLSIGRYYLGGAGTQNEALAFGGGGYCGQYTSCTENWNGTVWSTDAPLSSARYALGSAGNSKSAAIAFAGQNYDVSAKYCMDCTETYLDAGIYTKTSFTFNKDTGESVISDGDITGDLTGNVTGSLNLTSDLTIPSSNSLISEGDILNKSNNTVLGISTLNGITNTHGVSTNYNATKIKSCLEQTINTISPGAFTQGGALTTGRQQLAGAGQNSNSGLAFGGFAPAASSCTEEYDGTSWASGGNLITARGALRGMGIQNAALAVGGDTNPNINSASPVQYTCTEEYNGTAWSAGGVLISSKSKFGGAGFQNSAAAFGGISANLNNTGTCSTEVYNGTSWSTAENMLDSYFLNTGFGASSPAVVSVGGKKNFATTFDTLEYNGVSWSYSGNIPIGAFIAAGAGTQNAGWLFNQDDAFYYDGVGWSAGLNVLNDNLSYRGNSGCAQSLIFGGSTTSTCTEEWATNPLSTTTNFSVDTNGNITSKGSISSQTFSVDTSGNLTTTSGVNFTQNSSSIFTNKFNVESSNLNVTSLPGGFSVGGDMVRSDMDRGTGFGSLNAAVAAGGTNTDNVNNCTEEYNGISWSVGGNFITGRAYQGGTGTQNAGLMIGGGIWSPPSGLYPATSCTEEYDGSTWTTGGALISARLYPSGAGTQNAALSIGGQTSQNSTTALACTEEYDGSAWSAGGALIDNALRTYTNNAGSGTQNAGLTTGGNSGCTEEYNGSTWSTSGALTTGRRYLTLLGLQGASLAIAGGNPTISNAMDCTEEYNGEVWSVTSPVTVARRFHAGAGDTTSGVIFGGYDVPSNALNFQTNQYDNLGLIVPTFTTSKNARTQVTGGTSLNIINGSTKAWSNGGSLINGRRGLSGAGTQSSALAFGGRSDNCISFPESEEYNGAAWSVGGNLSISRYNLAGAGTQNAALAFGGRTPTCLGTQSTEEYDGSTWSNGGDLINGRCSHSGAGTQNAGLAFGGRCVNTTLSCTEEYDGSAWSAGGTLISARYNLAGTGAQNSALAIGGLPTQTCTEEYNGTTWSNGGTTLYNVFSAASSGTQNAALLFGGSPGAVCTSEYDGTTWTSASSLSCGRCCLAGAGTQTSALAFGGTNNTPSTEEYNCTATTETTFQHTDTGRLVFSQVSSSLDFVDDTAAAAGGVPLGGIYRSGGDIKIRLV